MIDSFHVASAAAAWDRKTGGQAMLREGRLLTSTLVVMWLATPLIGAAQSATSKGTTFQWSGELVAADSTTSTFTVKSRVAYEDALSELKQFKPGEKVLMVEDVVTTGLSSREAIAAIEQAGGQVIAAAALVDRSAGEVDLGVPFFPLVELSVPSYAEDELPPELAAIPVEKPGSRK